MPLKTIKRSNHGQMSKSTDETSEPRMKEPLCSAIDFSIDLRNVVIDALVVSSISSLLLKYL